MTNKSFHEWTVCLGVLVAGCTGAPHESSSGASSGEPRDGVLRVDGGSDVADSSGGAFATAQTLMVRAADFATRCAAPGVLVCEAFDASIPERNTGPNGVFVNGMAPGAPEVDTNVKASGAGSLRFTIPSNSGSSAGGQYFTNFSDDNSVKFGEGDEFYVQWRQRFSPDFVNTKFDGGGGWKQAIMGKGDLPGCDPGHWDAQACASSCTQLEIVVQNSQQRGLPQMYHSCGGKDDHYEPFEEPLPPYDFKLQNALPDCRYHGTDGCTKYRPDEWMSFQVHVKIGTWYKNDGNYHRDSVIELWASYEGQPSVQLIDFDQYDIANTSSPSALYGKVWLLPYHTGKSASQAHPVAYTWYDELIVSRTRIPDPT